MFVKPEHAVEDAICLASSRYPVFSVPVVAEIAGIEVDDAAVTGTVADWVKNGSLTEVSKTHEGDALLTPTAKIERWWIRTVLRWQHLGIRSLQPHELAAAMRASFGDFVDETPPIAIINVGVELRLIARTYDQQSFTSPWVNLIDAVDSIRGWLKDAARSESPRDCLCQPLEKSPSLEGFPTWCQILESLDVRQRQVLEMRLGLVSGQRHTLEAIGDSIGLTRERVRQLERTATQALQRSNAIRWAAPSIAREFVANGCSVLLNPGSTILRSPLFIALGGRGLHYVRSLGASVLADANWAAKYDQTIKDHQASIEFVLSDFASLPANLGTMLAKLPESDGRQLEEETRAYLRVRSAKLPRKAQVYIALRRLGTASHYSEVAEVCNDLWPDRPISDQATINTLMACEGDSRFGVVWIGRKGMYGLTEHGYTRPQQDLAATVADIVKKEYERTGAAVSIDTVMERMLDYRQHPDRSSVLMALSFNDYVADLGHYRYVPAGTERNGNDAVHESADEGYDFGSAFGDFAQSPNDPD